MNGASGEAGALFGHLRLGAGRSFTVAGTATFANGDGLCYINDKRELEGFRVNKAENNRIYPLQMPQRLRKGDALYRNNDQAFEKTLSRPTSQRKMSVNMELMSTPEGFAVKADVENIIQTTCAIAAEHQKAQKSQVENIQRQLGKMGNTPFQLNSLLLTGDVQQAFIPSSVLTELRRQVTDSLLEALQEHFATRRVTSSGSPPLARERQDEVRARLRHAGITPACAGKTFRVPARKGNLRDHPRLRGKDSTMRIAFKEA